MSAISFGVFCRSAPSTSLIMRSMRSSLARGDADPDPVGQYLRARRLPPNGRAGFADHGCGFTCDPASFTEATPSITSPSDGYVAGLTYDIAT